MKAVTCRGLRRISIELLSMSAAGCCCCSLTSRNDEEDQMKSFKTRRTRDCTPLVGAVAAVALATPAFGANLIANPGFESPTNPANPDSTVTAWTLVGEAQRATYHNHTPAGSEAGWAKTFLDT